MRKSGKQEKKVSVPVFLLSSFKSPPDQTCPPRAETRPAHVAVMSAESPTRRLPAFPSLLKTAVRLGSAGVPPAQRSVSLRCRRRTGWCRRRDADGGTRDACATHKCVSQLRISGALEKSARNFPRLGKNAACSFQSLEILSARIARRYSFAWSHSHPGQQTDPPFWRITQGLERRTRCFSKAWKNKVTLLAPSARLGAASRSSNLCGACSCNTRPHSPLAFWALQQPRHRGVTPSSCRRRRGTLPSAGLRAVPSRRADGG